VYGRETSKTLLQPHAFVAGLVAALAVAVLAFDSGGYEPTSWGWSAAALLLVSVAALLAGARRLTLLELALPASLAALASWIWLSLAWTSDVSQTVREGERVLVYVAAAAALLLVGRRSGVYVLVASLAAAITAVCAFALVTRLFDPGGGAYQVGLADPQAAFRLARPLGYANALAIFAVIGILLSLGLVRAGPRVTRAFASSALVVLAPTLYFTYGRGAWLGLAAGLVALFAIERDRLQVVVRALTLAAAPAVAVFLASRTSSLTADPRSVAAATHDGRRLAVAIAVLAVAAAFVPAAAERIRVSDPARRPLLLAAALVGIAVVAVGLVRIGGPDGAVERAYHAFNAPAPLVGQDTSGRLFSLSGSNRSEYWRVAWREWKVDPVLGGGAGSYQRFWLRHRRNDLPVRDAHSLYLETLAELGPLGLALLLCALAVPLAAVGAARRNPLAAGALGAYVAFLVHAGIDWDWEMPAVTLAALACGIALLLAARGDGRAPARNCSAHRRHHRRCAAWLRGARRPRRQSRRARLRQRVGRRAAPFRGRRGAAGAPLGAVVGNAVAPPGRVAAPGRRRRPRAQQLPPRHRRGPGRLGALARRRPRQPRRRTSGRARPCRRAEPAQLGASAADSGVVKAQRKVAEEEGSSRQLT
jgi:O-antigen ligase